MKIIFRFLFTIYAMAGIIIATAIVGSSVIVYSFFDKSGFCHIMANTWGKILLKIVRIKVKVIGSDRFDPEKTYIFMGNHQSHFDIPVIMSNLDIQYRWLAKAELFKIPIFGKAMEKVGYVKIDRFNKEAAFSSIDSLQNILNNNISVVIFPEGTRSKSDTIMPFKKGGFVLAMNSRIPVVPVAIYGTMSILPKNHFFINSGRVVIEFMKPIDTKQFNNKEELMDVVRQQITETYNRLKKDYTFCG